MKKHHQQRALFTLHFPLITRLSGSTTVQLLLCLLYVKPELLSNWQREGRGLGREPEGADSFQSRRAPLTLTLGGLWGPTPFLAPLLGLSFQGPTDLTHPGPPPTGSGGFPAGLGAKVWALRGPGPGPGGLGPASLHANTGRRRCTRAPAAPREPGHRAAPPRPPPGVLEVEDPGPRRQWRGRKRAPPLPRAASRLGRAVGGAGQRGLPPSCFRPGGELRAGVRLRAPPRDVGDAAGSRCGVFALVPGRGGPGPGDVRWRARPRLSRGRPLRRARARELGSRGRGPQGPAAGWGTEEERRNEQGNGRERKGGWRGRALRYSLWRGSRPESKPAQPPSEGGKVIFIPESV